MFKFIKNILIVLYIVTIVSCFGCTASRTTENYSKICKTWMGADINELIGKWGVPSNEYTKPNGDIMYSWLRVGSTQVTTSYSYWLGQVNTNKVTYYCNTTFTVNSHGEIIDWTWKGNACLAEDPDEK